MQGGRYKLLVVDDIAANRDLLTRYFGSRGFQIGEADCGLTALSMINQERFNAVFLDILMPEIDGIEVLKRIRASHTIDHLPVIMVSALSAHRDVKLALDLGANDYVTKPVDLASALTKLERVLAVQKQKETARAEHLTGVGAAGEPARSRKEMRRKPRRQSQCTAWLLIEKQVPPIECLVTDLSMLGARIALQSDQNLPDHFILLLSANGTAWQNCRLVWKNGLKAGIEFTGGSTDKPRPGTGTFVDCLL